MLHLGRLLLNIEALRITNKIKKNLWYPYKLNKKRGPKPHSNYYGPYIDLVVESP